jgi:hypothetical protein
MVVVLVVLIVVMFVMDQRLVDVVALDAENERALAFVHTEMHVDRSYTRTRGE